MAKPSHRCPYDVAFTAQGRAILMVCGQWSCPKCSKVNARIWAWRVKLHIKAHPSTWYFITLTLPGTIEDVAYGYKILPRLWDVLRKKLAKQARRWQYVAFVEGQPKRRGMPHFHIISDQKAPYRIKDFAVSCGFGFMAHQTVIDGPRAASYCSKYASKTDARMPKGFRRVRASHGWTKLPEREKKETYIVRARRERAEAYIMRVHEASGVAVQELADKYYVAMQQLSES